MKKFTYCILFVITLSLAQSNAQYCTVTTAVPYATTMPGISNFTLNTINRSSAVCENGCIVFSSNNYTNTGLSTTLTKGNTYSISITHNIDNSICPDMNLRVWIDYNQDFQLDDAGETVLSVDHHLAGTYTASFTVPTTAMNGTTKMRVTAKMSDLGGHSIPTPCDNPPDPIGYHGEIEDYSVTLTSPTGLEDLNASHSPFYFYRDPVDNNLIINFHLDQMSGVALNIRDILGKKLASFPSADISAGSHTMNLNSGMLNIKRAGVYFIEMLVDNKRFTGKFVVQ